MVIEFGFHAKVQKILNSESSNSFKDGSEKVIWKFFHCMEKSFLSVTWIQMKNVKNMNGNMGREKKNKGSL